MRHLLKTLVLTGLIVAAAATANAQISFGIHIGEPPPPRAYRVPPRPGPDYVWVEGYQYPVGKTYKWHDGYWTRPPVRGCVLGCTVSRGRTGTTPAVGKVVTGWSTTIIAGTAAKNETSTTTVTARVVCRMSCRPDGLHDIRASPAIVSS